eukprot:TRINITY_DN2896_c1_g2_i3.p1 TRINITY_DN2896_c1_g2~~TRINITY_DN2896_c1_g2_i3.p1  ORF type:complete len:148 (+),score=42.80 TRINITY_DN2896_c1_g2_i3:1-444(+)
MKSKILNLTNMKTQHSTRSPSSTTTTTSQDDGIPPDSFAKEYSTVLKQWLPKNHKLELLYRGSRDGFSSKDFHSKCDNKGATLTLVKSTSEDMFGGYTPIKWTPNGDDAIDKDTFIFTLKNQHNIPPTKFTRNPFKQSNGPLMAMMQ